ncbi:hypothetical protein ACFLYU_01675 [Candidatus Dependentiae bacterium]
MKKENNIKKNNMKASALLQLSLFFGFIIIVFILLYKPLVNFKSNESYPDITPLTPSKITALKGSPVPVEVGIYIKDMPNFDIIRGNFLFDLTIWFKFDNRLVSLERISKFKFDKATIIEKSRPHIKIEKDKIIARYDVKINLDTTLNYKDFPLDDHRLSISLTNYQFTPSDVIFESSMLDFVINPKIQTTGWKRIAKEVATGFLEDKTYYGKKANIIHHPRIIFSLYFAKIGIRHIMTVLLPLLMIFFIAIITLTFDPFGPKRSNITPISVAAVTAIIAHRFIIDHMAPKTGYFMISDLFFFLFLLGCIVIFIINLFSAKISGYKKNITVIILYILSIIAFIYILYPLLI